MTPYHDCGTSFELYGFEAWKDVSGGNDREDPTGPSRRGVRSKRIVEELCGTEVSSTQVSRAAGELDEMLAAWRCRDLGCYRYVILDAQYEKIRRGGQVLDASVLIACGVDDNEDRGILGCSVSLSEVEAHWRSFLVELKDRGLHGLELVVSDSHQGRKAARKAVLPSVPWQRCQFHLLQHAGA